MTLHIYNPEHDIALGKNLCSFTPPKAARLTKEKFCHLPALWAKNGDMVLVDDVDKALDNIAKDDRKFSEVKFVTLCDLSQLTEEDMPYDVKPWGWDKLIATTLLKANKLFKNIIPSFEQIEKIRNISSRVFNAEKILPEIIAKDDCFVGKMVVLKGELSAVKEIIEQSVPCVLKAPWSCSGRGVRFVDNILTNNDLGWINNVLVEQNNIMLEPLYNKVMDFAMEFDSQNNGVIKYLGLSLFETNGGSYLSNMIASEEEKQKMLSKYIVLLKISIIKDTLISALTPYITQIYNGPFGVDMMLVDIGGEIKIHPCVEINLRRTMGYAALF